MRPQPSLWLGQGFSSSFALILSWLFVTLSSLLAYMCDNLDVFVYERSMNDKSDLDNSPNCEPYVVDQVEQILRQSDLDKIFESVYC